MFDGPERDFRLDIDIYLETYSNRFNQYDNNTLIAMRADFMKDDEEFTLPISSNISKPVRLHDSDSKDGSMYVVSLSVLVSKEDVKLWWPNGAGEQNLYSFHIQYRDKFLGLKSSWVEKRIGKTIPWMQIK